MNFANDTSSCKKTFEEQIELYWIKICDMHKIAYKTSTCRIVNCCSANCIVVDILYF